MTADRLAAFADEITDKSKTMLLLDWQHNRRIVLALCDVAKAAEAWRMTTDHRKWRDECDRLVKAVDALSTALAEPSTDQKER